MKSETGIEFPRGTYYAVLWGLDRDFGGMTSALLHRSRAFGELAGVPVTVITYAHDEDLDGVRQHLRDRGALVDGLDVINLWEDLRTWDDDRLRTALSSVAGTDIEHFDPLVGRGSERTPLREIKRRDDGKVLQTDYYREDGTLMVSHRQFVFGDSGVQVTICDSAGEPIGYWNAVRKMYRFWLDSLPKEPVAFMIIDSKTSANHYPDYRRDDAITLYMVHGSHLANGSDTVQGELSAGRAYSFGRLEGYDGVVFLTKRQREDVQQGLGPFEHLYDCPNSRDTATQHAVRRGSRQGIAVGALAGGKRFHHAIEAIAVANSHGARAKLTIFGRGPKQKSLDRAIAKKRLGRRVKLGGYTTQSDLEFARSSFVLMTSTREGLGLVLIEAMAQGCVPIAYDIAYGPSEIITHGVDGFLVTPGDTDELGRVIASFCKLPKREREKMRAAAIERSRDFNDTVVVERWSEIFVDALERKPARARTTS